MAWVKLKNSEPCYSSNKVVDRCCVEVFANHDERLISDLIFPPLSSRGIEFYSKGGEAKIVKLNIWNIRSMW